MGKTVGIICECNPFHAGHGYLIESARKSGADCIVCVMSGCFVQRGEAAVADPYLRAEAVLCGGADLVLELPFPYAAASAEIFARAGVDILTRVGVDELWFGSECGDLDCLQCAARICETPAFAERYAHSVGENRGTAQAYFETLAALSGTDLALSPNDILAISYLRALTALGSGIEPVTVRREGSAYHAQTLEAQSYPSASALRKIWREEGVEAILPHLPPACREIYAGVSRPVDLAYADRLILGYFRLTDPAKLEACAELSGGLGNRMAQAAVRARSTHELIALAATKKYPTSRLRRGILFALTQILPEHLHTDVAYTRLLAANATGRAYLSETRKAIRIPIITRKTELPEHPRARCQSEWESRAWALWTLCHPDSAPADWLWKLAPRMK
ncbi:MAG: nucleotidyltransferase family protein [Ruminococcaceae bacterium]|nr:nucleotidyltransferase family protein [Oscillospiraceae bacterium]